MNAPSLLIYQSSIYLNDIKHCRYKPTINQRLKDSQTFENVRIISHT